LEARPAEPEATERREQPAETEPTADAPSAPRRPLLWLALGATAGLGLAAWSLIAPGAPASGALPEGAVAVVNGAAIRVEDYRRLLAGLERDLKGPLDDARRHHVLERMIEEELLVQRAIDLGFARLDRQVRGELTSSVIQSVVASAEDREPSEAELREFHRENRSFFSVPPRLRVRQIFFRLPSRREGAGRDLSEVRARAEEARALLVAGRPFEVVRAGFGDDEISTVPDALLPPAKLREYVGPTALEAAMALEEGGVSQPVRSGVGLHVIQLVEREPPRIPDFEDVAPQVASEWRRRAGDEALRAYLDELRAASDVIIDPDLP
jgi:parvulin-like peptidyl-prolyl isomerase